MIDLSNLNVEKEKYINNFLDDISKFKRVMLWGLSESADVAIDFFESHNIKVDGIYDDDISKNGTYHNGVVIVNPGDDVYDKDTALVITCSYYENIRNLLFEKDPNIDSRLFMYDGYFMSNEYLYDNDNVLSIINNNYNNLSDDKSKILYEALLRYRYIRDISIIQNLYESRSECYLDKLFLDKFKNGLYIDAGSYNADFITTLGERVDISKSKFYIFEPNKIFSNNIENNLRGKYNFKIFNEALCDVEGEMEFQQIASSTSHLVDKKYNAYDDKLEQSTEIVKVNKLDNIISDEKVSGIKVDIEGSEMAMLIGATEIIKRDLPIMMISIYHRWTDLWEIQDYIKNLNLGYKFYIRHYSLSVAKTILYCIPSEYITLSVDKDPYIKVLSDDNIINLTGQSGSGKSTYASTLDSVIVVDTDEILSERRFINSTGLNRELGEYFREKYDVLPNLGEDFDLVYKDIVEKVKDINKTIVIDCAQFHCIKDINLLRGKIIILRTCIDTCYQRCIDRYKKNNPNATLDEIEKYKNKKLGIYDWYKQTNEFIDKLDRI